MLEDSENSTKFGLYIPLLQTGQQDKDQDKDHEMENQPEEVDT